MLTTLVGIALLAGLPIAAMTFLYLIGRKSLAAKGNWFTVGFYEWSAVRSHRLPRSQDFKVVKETIKYQVILYANEAGGRKVEVTRDCLTVAKQMEEFILYVQPWLEKTIDTEKLIRLSDGAFKVATVNHNKLDQPE